MWGWRGRRWLDGGGRGGRRRWGGRGRRRRRLRCRKSILDLKLITHHFSMQTRCRPWLLESCPARLRAPRSQLLFLTMVGCAQWYSSCLKAVNASTGSAVWTEKLEKGSGRHPRSASAMAVCGLSREGRYAASPRPGLADGLQQCVFDVAEPQKGS